MTYRRFIMATPLTVIIVALCATTGLVAGSAGASIAGKSSLTLSGAGKGKLQEGSSGVCTNARGAGVDLIDLTGSITGFKSAATWTLTVLTQSAKAGTYSVTKNGTTTAQLDPMKKHSTFVASEEALLYSSSGTMTFKGEKGSLNITFGTGQKAVTVKGTWNCSA
jgi:hypothetical protein